MILTVRKRCDLAFYAAHLLAAAISLSIVCSILRIKIQFYEFKNFFDSLSDLANIGWILRVVVKNPYFDLLFVWSTAAIAFFACIVCILLQSSPRFVIAMHTVLSIVIVLMANINYLAVQFIGGSLTYQWLYYADFFRSFTARSAILPALNTTFFGMILLSFALWIVVHRIALHIFSDVFAHKVFLRFAASISLIMASYFLVIHNFLDQSDASRAKFTNPILEITSTAFLGHRSLSIESENAIIPPALPPATAGSMPSDLTLGNLSIQNVILIVMESVGAKYVSSMQTYPSAIWTPAIERYRTNTLTFSNIYTPSPNSTKALTALITSHYPMFSVGIDTIELSDMVHPTLASRLSVEGYATSFFMSGDLQFQHVEYFLESKGFDELVDMRNISCDMPIYVGSTSEWPFLDAVDDSCTARALIRWLDTVSPRPFFSIFWTGNTHWPYFSPEPPTSGELADDPHLNRYLGALQSTDSAIGLVLDYLVDRELFDSTLVIITGDHGEAFGEHGFKIHGSSIYEEEVNVPFLFINSNIKNIEVKSIGSLIDVGPTIIDALGFAPEERWGGRSLFDPNRAATVFMFAPNQEMVAGYRKDNHKFIYYPARGVARVFDLKSDPFEKVDLGDSSSTAKIRDYLAGWLSKQTEIWEELGQTR